MPIREHEQPQHTPPHPICKNVAIITVLGHTRIAFWSGGDSGLGPICSDSNPPLARFDTNVPGSRNPAADDLNAREDRLLRIGNGINDDRVFPKLRDMGVAEEDLHAATMRLVRYVQYGLDTSGVIARFLGVKRLPPPAHGTIAAEVS